MMATAIAYSELADRGIIGTSEPLSKPMEWFILGSISFASAEVLSLGIDKLMTKLRPTNNSGMAGFGETVEELDAMIDKYQKHIVSLKKVLAVGSAQGKAIAQQKLAQEEKVLAELLERREDELQD